MARKKGEKLSKAQKEANKVTEPGTVPANPKAGTSGGLPPHNTRTMVASRAVNQPLLTAEGKK
jgi:hypothetical protein